MTDLALIAVALALAASFAGLVSGAFLLLGWV